MNVYITFEPNGYDGDSVEKVFSKEADAQDHVIENSFKKNSFYDGKEKHELEEAALEFIEAHEVI